MFVLRLRGTRRERGRQWLASSYSLTGAAPNCAATRLPKVRSVPGADKPRGLSTTGPRALAGMSKPASGSRFALSDASATTPNSLPPRPKIPPRPVLGGFFFCPEPSRLAGPSQGGSKTDTKAVVNSGRFVPMASVFDGVSHFEGGAQGPILRTRLRGRYRSRVRGRG